MVAGSGFDIEVVLQQSADRLVGNMFCVLVF